MTALKVDSPSTDSSSDSRSGETLDIIARETGIDRSLLLPDATIEALGVASLDLTLALFELEKQDLSRKEMPFSGSRIRWSRGTILESSQTAAAS